MLEQVYLCVCVYGMVYREWMNIDAVWESESITPKPNIELE